MADQGQKVVRFGRWTNEQKSVDSEFLGTNRIAVNTRFLKNFLEKNKMGKTKKKTKKETTEKDFTEIELTLPMKIWGDNTMLFREAKASGKYNGEEFDYSTNMDDGMPIVYYRGTYATIPIRDIIGNAIEQIDKKLDGEKK